MDGGSQELAEAISGAWRHVVGVLDLVEGEGYVEETFPEVCDEFWLDDAGNSYFRFGPVLLALHADRVTTVRMTDLGDGGMRAEVFDSRGELVSDATSPTGDPSLN